MEGLLGRVVGQQRTGTPVDPRRLARHIPSTLFGRSVARQQYTGVLTRTRRLPRARPAILHSPSDAGAPHLASDPRPTTASENRAIIDIGLIDSVPRMSSSIADVQVVSMCIDDLEAPRLCQPWSSSICETCFALAAQRGGEGPGNCTAKSAPVMLAGSLIIPMRFSKRWIMRRSLARNSSSNLKTVRSLAGLLSQLSLVTKSSYNITRLSGCPGSTKSWLK
mmetsp:Transcript_90683/g.252467  ORF Transcript_90683/g.252467 Transcript_90683/m.252467 type:complete len:222 (-) Transcript_90683:974-1639(-)